MSLLNLILDIKEPKNRNRKPLNGAISRHASSANLNIFSPAYTKDIIKILVT
jgi:hypothetical protein